MFVAILEKSVWFPQKCFSIYEMYDKYINNWCFTFHSIFMQKYEKLTPKSQYFGIFHHLAKCQKWAFLATVQDKMEWREIVFTQLFMTLNGLYNNMVSWVLWVIYK